MAQKKDEGLTPSVTTIMKAAAAYVPKKKLGPDIGIRLGRKTSLKPKLEAIAFRNGISLNDLIIYICEWYLAERGHGRDFSITIK